MNVAPPQPQRSARDLVCLVKSDRVERDGATVRLLSFAGEALRRRTYRGSNAEAWAQRQAFEWAERFGAYFPELDGDERP